MRKPTFPLDLTPITDSRRLRAGEVLRLHESDYMYGVGALILEVVHFDPLIDHPNIEWVRIAGHKISLFNYSRSKELYVVDVKVATIAARKMPAPPLPAPKPVERASDL